VVLCSLTTLIGYISLYTSSNQALNSFGLAMSLGEITCLLASVAALPALLVAIEGRGTTEEVSKPGAEG
jgi:predicted RND superfamily exporter protein